MISNAIDILVAADIVARGIDIDDIQLVINFDVPRDEEDYVHRIGRTARAGKGGRAITLVSEKDQFYFRQIERFLEHEVEKLEVPAELGDAPEYTGRNGGSKDKQRGRGGKGRGRGGDSHRHRDRKPKGENATRRVETSTRGIDSSQASQQPQPHVENQPAAEGEKKRKKRHRHHRPKQNPSNESQA